MVNLVVLYEGWGEDDVDNDGKDGREEGGEEGLEVLDEGSGVDGNEAGGMIRGEAVMEGHTGGGDVMLWGSCEKKAVLGHLFFLP